MLLTSPPARPEPDREHLKLIEIFHYVMIGIAVLGAGFLFFHYFMMSSMTEMIAKDPKFIQQQKAQGMPFNPADFFKIFRWFYVMMGAWSVASALLNLASGLCIRARKARTFSLVVAGLNCINFPFGTALGVFTFIVLLRPTVARTYEAAHP